MVVTLEQLEEELSRKRAEVSDLEIAVRVLRRMESSRNGKTIIATADLPPKSESDQPKTAASQSGGQTLAGKTMSQCAVAIIMEKGPTHYKKIAEIAMQRGYKTPRGISDSDTVTSSFWATMNRDKETFASQDGIYRLRENDPPS